ncbi:MAG: hypothetical protein AAGM46_27615 [Cyanobacteria bacterium J06582_2]
MYVHTTVQAYGLLEDITGIFMIKTITPGGAVLAGNKFKINLI